MLNCAGAGMRCSQLQRRICALPAVNPEAQPDFSAAYARHAAAGKASAAAAAGRTLVSGAADDDSRSALELSRHRECLLCDSHRVAAEHGPAVEDADVEAVGTQAALRPHQRALPGARARRRAPAMGSRKQQQDPK